MLNNSKLKNWVYIVLGLFVLAGMFASGVLAWGDLANKIEYNAVVQERIVADADDLEVKGCEPAGKNKLDIALIQKDIETLRKSSEAIQADTKEILKRLPK